MLTRSSTEHFCCFVCGSETEVSIFKQMSSLFILSTGLCLHNKDSICMQVTTSENTEMNIFLNHLITPTTSHQLHEYGLRLCRYVNFCYSLAIIKLVDQPLGDISDSNRLSFLLLEMFIFCCIPYYTHIHTHNPFKVHCANLYFTIHLYVAFV